MAQPHTSPAGSSRVCTHLRLALTAPDPQAAAAQRSAARHTP
jgi:hypothetical protein